MYIFANIFQSRTSAADLLYVSKNAQTSAEDVSKCVNMCKLNLLICTINTLLIVLKTCGLNETIFADCHHHSFGFVKGDILWTIEQFTPK